MRTGVYCRISKDRTGEALGVARQEQDGRKAAAERGWDVVDVYTDNDLSAAKRGVHRPAYERLLADVESRRIEAIIVWDLDRLVRRPVELETFVEACDLAGMRHLVFSAGGGTMVDITGDGLLLARIKGAIAAEEVRKLRQRVQRKTLELAERGLPKGGGRRAYGYERDGATVCESEAAILRECAADLLAGGTLKAAAERTGMAPESLKRSLMSPRVAGLRVHRGQIIGDAVWPAIFDRVTWERLCAVLANKRNAWRTPYRKHLLTGGLAVCAECGTNLLCQIRGGAQAKNGPYYFCRSHRGGCGKVAVSAARIEEHVTQTVRGWLTDAMADRVTRVLAGDTDGMVEQLAADRAMLDDLAAMLARRDITPSEWRTARTEVAGRVAGAEAKLAARMAGPVPAVTAAELADAWDALTFDEMRSVLRTLVASVAVASVGRGRRRFQPSRVEIVPAEPLAG